MKVKGVFALKISVIIIYMCVCIYIYSCLYNNMLI